MEFSNEERERFELIYKEMRELVGDIMYEPNSRLFAYNLQKFPHVEPHTRKRLSQLHAMSRAEFMAEVEADYVLWGDFGSVAGDYISDVDIYAVMGEERLRLQVDEHLKHIRTRQAILQHTPDVRGLVPGKDLYIWERLEATVAMTDEELRNDIEADTVLFKICV